MIGNVIYVVIETYGENPDAVAAFTSQGAALDRALERLAYHGFDPTGYESPDDAIDAYNLAPGSEVYIDVAPVIVVA